MGMGRETQQAPTALLGASSYTGEPETPWGVARLRKAVQYALKPVNALKQQKGTPRREEPEHGVEGDL